MILRYLKEIGARPSSLSFTRKEFVDAYVVELAADPADAVFVFDSLRTSLADISLLTNDERRKFIDALDSSGIDLGAWEASFVASMMSWTNDYSPAQSESIDRLIKKYQKRIRWS